MRARIHIFATLLLIIWGSAQAQVEVPEEQLSIDIIKWHYSRYPNSQENHWFMLPESGNVQVSCVYEGALIKATYNSKGRIQSEIKDMTGSIPVSLTHDLDIEYADNKYKVIQFTKLTDFVNDVKMYEMEIKSKLKGVETKKFDADLIPLAISDYRTSVSSN